MNTNLKAGSVVLIGNRRWGGSGFKAWLTNLVTTSITKVTDSPYIHVKVFLDGFWWESTTPNGATKTQETFVTNELNQLLKPKRDLTPEEIKAMIAFGETAINTKMKYNYIKLILLAIIYPTRKFWNKIGWIPFQNNEMFGSVCSVYVDEMFKVAGIDLYLNNNEEYTAPGDFLKMDFFEKI